MNSSFAAGFVVCEAAPVFSLSVRVIVKQDILPEKSMESFLDYILKGDLDLDFI